MSGWFSDGSSLESSSGETVEGTSVSPVSPVSPIGFSRWAEVLLDRMVVEGSAIPAVFLLLALLQFHEADLMQIEDADSLQTAILSLPWNSLTDSSIPAILGIAESLAAETPASVFFAAYGAFSLASAGLLPRGVRGTPRLWRSRLAAMYR